MKKGYPNIYKEIPYEFFEISLLPSLRAKWDERLNQVAMEYLDLDISEPASHLLFRFFTLPVEPCERINKVNEIAKHGSDRTNPNQVSKGNIACTCSPQEFTFDGTKRFRLFELFDTLYPQPNALLIFDSTQITSCNKCVKYHFSDPEKRTNALIKIVGITTG